MLYNHGEEEKREGGLTRQVSSGMNEGGGARRLLSSGFISAPSHPPHIDVDHCKNNFDAVAGSNARGDHITFTNDRETTPTYSKELLNFGFGLVSPKHHHHSGNNQDDDDHEKHPCATPYSTKHQIKQDMPFPFPCPLHRYCITCAYLLAPSIQQRIQYLLAFNTD